MLAEPAPAPQRSSRRQVASRPPRGPYSRPSVRKERNPCDKMPTSFNAARSPRRGAVGRRTVRRHRMGKDMTPEIGAKAPDFALTGTGGKRVALKDFIGKKNLVLYFYPKDDTPGCTMEACGFRDAFGSFEEKDNIILGVSRDGPESHQRFSSKYKLPFLLLSDP